MRAIVLCEVSGKVRDALRARGHDAWSNDIKQADGCSNYHIQSDCVQALQSREWDLVIMHPPCTALAVSGNGTYAYGKRDWPERQRSIEWTIALWNLATSLCDKVCMENPVGVLSTSFKKPTQYIQPWQFGHGETKKTGLWLHGLPKLTPTDIVEGREQRIWKMGPSDERSTLRSETYTGIARAMAEQWG